MAARRQRVELSLKRKLELIEEVEKGGMSQSEVARQNNLPATTMSTIFRNKEKIRASLQASEFQPSRKRMRKSQENDLEEYLFTWFQTRRSQNLPVTAPLLHKKANDLAEKLGVENFQARLNWVYRFKARRGIASEVIGKANSHFVGGNGPTKEYPDQIPVYSCTKPPINGKTVVLRHSQGPTECLDSNSLLSCQPFHERCSSTMGNPATVIKSEWSGLCTAESDSQCQANGSEDQVFYFLPIRIDTHLLQTQTKIEVGHPNKLWRYVSRKDGGNGKDSDRNTRGTELRCQKLSSCSRTFQITRSLLRQKQTCLPEWNFTS